MEFGIEDIIPASDYKMYRAKLRQVNRKLKGEFLEELKNKQEKLTTEKEKLLKLVINLMDTPSSRLAKFQKTHPNVDEARQF